MKIDYSVYGSVKKRKKASISSTTVLVSFIIIVIILLVGLTLYSNSMSYQKEDTLSPISTDKNHPDNGYITTSTSFSAEDDTLLDENFVLNILPDLQESSKSGILSSMKDKKSIKGHVVTYDSKKWVVQSDISPRRSHFRKIKLKRGNKTKTIVINKKENSITVDDKKIREPNDKIIVSTPTPPPEKEDVKSSLLTPKPEKQAPKRNYSLPQMIDSTKKRENPPIVKTAQKLKVRLMYSANSLKSHKIYAKKIEELDSVLSGAIFIGSVSGYTLDRLDVDFRKIKLKTGKEYPITAHAVGIDNTPGIKGKRKDNAGTNAAKSVASTAIDFSSVSMLGNALDSALDPALSQNKNTVVSVKEGVEFYVFFDEDFGI